MYPQSITTSLRGFLRTGIYGELYNNKDSDIFSSAWGDGGVKLDLRNDYNFRAYAELRYRYGSEFRKPVSVMQLKEGWISVYKGRFEMIVGQRIIKWGRADFDNPTSSFNPRNLVVRSPEKEDMDLGNLSATLIFKPAGFMSLQAVVTPFYRPDILVTAPLSLPDNVKINEIDGLLGGRQMAGYGLKADFYLRGIDFSISGFHGNDPLPGIRYDGFILDTGGSTPVLDIMMSVTPYRVNRAGFDFEAAAGRFGLRGEAAYTKPVLSFPGHSYVPMPEVKWAAGADITLGSFMIGAEYIGKYITDFYPTGLTPSLPGEMPPLTPDMIDLIVNNPDIFNIFVGNTIAAFNSLYMYQLEKSYHSAGFRVEADLAAGRLLPGIVGIYNFTSGDLALVPSVKYKPADGITLLIGADIYKGRDGSLYDIIDKPLTNFFVSFRTDF